jgi:hypothetical protein
MPLNWAFLDPNRVILGLFRALLGRVPWILVDAGGDPGVDPARCEEEPIAELSAAATTPPVAVWAPIRAAEDPRDTP